MTRKNWQGKVVAVLAVAVCILTAFLYVGAQDNPGDAIGVTPTPIVFPPPTSPYPELICPYFQNVQVGSSWQGITIGISTQSDLEAVLAQFGRYEIIYPAEGSLATSIRYSWTESSDHGSTQHAPLHVDLCFQNSAIVVMEISWTNQEPLYLADLVVSLGLPDVVTWSPSQNRRSVFWLERGISAEIFVQRGDAASFGRLTRLIYFPPQSSEGYETRWPFSVTRMQPFFPADPSVPSEQNPFDFDAMIATITAEPSRTPTPTFAPVSSAPATTDTP